MKHIEHFFVGKDIQIQIDHNNKGWFDNYGKLLVEDINQYLMDNGFVEDKIGEWRDTDTGKVYELTEGDIEQLKRSGFCRMYLIKE